jgi:hypothetical protein
MLSRSLNKLFVIAATAVVLAAPAAATAFEFADLFHHGTRGDGELVAVPFELAACSEVVLQCGLDIDVTFGPQQKITLRMDQNLVENFKIEERGGVLVVDAVKNPRPSRHACLEVTLRTLDRLAVEGAGDVSIRGYDGERLALAIDGAGDVDVEGRAGEVVVSVDGAGDIDARHLEARVADVTVNGAGDVDIFASESATTVINGVGDIDVYGKPAEFTKDVNGVGAISRR